KEKKKKKKINKKEKTKTDVEKIDDKTLKAKGLDDVITDSQKGTIVTIVYNTYQSKTMNQDPENLKKQATDLKDKLSDKAKDLNTDENRGTLQTIIHNIISFFQNLFNTIIDFFKGLFN